MIASIRSGAIRTRSCSDELDPSQASPAGLTRGSIIFAKGWIAGSSPAMTANGASTSSEHALGAFVIDFRRGLCVERATMVLQHFVARIDDVLYLLFDSL